jgi:hypothetical protein
MTEIAAPLKQKTVGFSRQKQFHPYLDGHGRAAHATTLHRENFGRTVVTDPQQKEPVALPDLVDKIRIFQALHGIDKPATSIPKR